LGLVVAGFVAANKDVKLFHWAPSISRWLALAALAILALVMVRVPLAIAGRPDEPAPPTAIM